MESIPCGAPGCNKTFGSTYARLNHLRHSHNATGLAVPSAKYPCAVSSCSSRFVTETDQREHMRSVHGRRDVDMGSGVKVSTTRAPEPPRRPTPAPIEPADPPATPAKPEVHIIPADTAPVGGKYPCTICARTVSLGWQASGTQHKLDLAITDGQEVVVSSEVTTDAAGEVVDSKTEIRGPEIMVHEPERQEREEHVAEVKVHICEECEAEFDTPQGLALHRTRKHKGKGGNPGGKKKPRARSTLIESKAPRRAPTAAETVTVKLTPLQIEALIGLIDTMDGTELDVNDPEELRREANRIELRDLLAEAAG